MSAGSHHISVCICTFRRPAMLRRLLVEVARQRTDDQFTFSIIVVDNDDQKSAQPVVAEVMEQFPVKMVYCHEARQNIALVRNKTLELAEGNWIAFIDDDEFPVSEWLLMMLKVCEEHQAAGVLGPVRPYFDESPPGWIIKGRFCERPEYPSGTVIPWDESRTGNVLFRRSIVDGMSPVFDLQFGNGGEDKDFFMRMNRLGHVFRWCNEGVTYESVPPARWTRSYMLRRALLRGKNTLKIRAGRARRLATSAVAVPIYSLVLLPAMLVGQHVFMKYCIKLCDHLGRLLAFARINPVNER
jgi:succinoglycan biosynthesis protein ExoM